MRTRHHEAVTIAHHHRDDLADFDARSFDHDGDSRTVHVAGTGPAVSSSIIRSK